MAEFSLSRDSDFVFDYFCELCIEENLQKEADGYCVDCGEYLCQSCYQAHRKTRATRHHVLQGKDGMPKGTPLSLNRVNMDITTKCQQHSGELVKYYCGSHNALGCSECFAEGTHRGCSKIESIVKISVSISENREFKNFLGQIQSMQKKARDILTNARENQSLSQRCCADVVSSVRKMKEEAIAKLNEAEQTIVALTGQMKTEDEEKMASVENDCETLSGKLEQMSSDVESLQIAKRVCQLYINMRESQGEMKALQKNLEKLEAVNVVRTFRFEPNPDLASVLSSPEVLGKVSHQRQSAAQMTRRTTDEGGRAAAGSRDADTTATSQPARVTSGNPVSSVDGSKMTASFVGDINVESDSDRYVCDISGSAVVSEDRLLLVDWENTRVKLVDTRTQRLLSQLKLPSQPFDVTVINTNQAAVTLPNSQKILLLGVADTLTSQREITVRGTCRGVAYSQDRLVVTFVDSPRVEIIDLRGNVIRRIEDSSDGSRLFEWPWYVCVSRDNVTLYVSDYSRDTVTSRGTVTSRDTVTSLTFDGVVKSIYKDKELICPCKVCTDHHGNVYVCGYNSRNVHMMTADCRKVKVILTVEDGLNSPVQSVCHCQVTNRLFIGMLNNNNVKVFQLSQK